MKTHILILLASIATTFAQVAVTPKAVDPNAPLELTVPIAKPVGEDLLEARILAKKTQFATNQTSLEKLKAQLIAAKSARPENPTKLEELQTEFESLAVSTENLERELLNLEDERTVLRRKALADNQSRPKAVDPIAPPNSPVELIVPIPKPVAEPARAGRNKKPTPAANDPFVKGGGEAPKPDAPADERPANYQVLFETFDLSREDFLALLDEKGDDDVRYRRVAEWMAAGRAKLTTFTAITTRSGQRSKVEAIDEVLYATEFDAPSSEGDVASPTTFEVRNAGETLELELMVGEDGQSADVNIAPQSVTLLRFVDELAVPDKANSAISQPRFGARSLATNARAQMNRPRLIGTLSGASEQGGIPAEVRVAFLTVRRANLPKPKPEALVKEAMQARLEYTFFSLERSAARDLCLAKPEPQACYDGLRALVGEKKARLEHVSINVTKWGQQTRTTETQEVLYATNWTGGGARTAPPAKPKDAPNTPDAPQKPQPNGAAAIPVVATTFERKNTGFSSQAEPMLGEDGATADINLALDFVRYSGLLEVTGIAKKYPPQPLFQTSRVTTPLYMTVGEQQLIGTLNTPAESGANGRKDDGRVWLGFVRAVLVK